MLYELWGAAVTLGITRPSGPLSYALLLLTLSALLLVLYRLRAVTAWRSLSRRQWVMLALLCAAGLLLSQLFPLGLPWLSAILRQHPVTANVALFSATPYLLAGAAFNTPAAMVVGLFTGLGRAVGQTGTPLDIIAGAFAAGLSSALLRQHYSGRFFGAFRRPILAALVGRVVLALFAGAHVFVEASSEASPLGALDLALFVGIYSLVPLALEGLVGGALASACLLIAPQWRPTRGLVPSPLTRSLQRQLVAAFLSFAAVVVLLSAIMAFILSGRASARALAEQMAYNADAVAGRLGALQGALSDALVRAGSDPALASVDAAAKSVALSRLRRETPQFDSVKLVAGASVISDIRASGNELSEAESELVTIVTTAGEPRLALAESATGRVVNLAVPRTGADDQLEVLLGQVAPAALAGVMEALPLPDHTGQSLITDELSRVVLRSDGQAASGEWVAPGAAEAALLLSGPGNRRVYQTLTEGGSERQLVYYALVPESGWKVVANVPMADSLRQALGVTGPLALLLLAVSGLFFAYVAGLGRAISQPIAEMGWASKAIAGGGGLERPVRPQREDEIGQLALAFSQMQRALRQRLDELSLLLSVSNDVAATMRIDEGMSAVLQGVLRGTGATGARAVIRNPNTSAPLVFAEGPAAAGMSVLDRSVVRRMRTSDEMALGSPEEIQAELGQAGPVAALFALPLRLAGNFQGALYLGYRQPHYFDSDERGLLRTLAGQASVLVQNAYLFAAAEGGRRRLAAVLASSPQPIIVTDPTDRVLLINPAMEGAFDLQARSVAGQPIADALRHLENGDTLAGRLSMSTVEPPAGPLELEVRGRSFQVNVSNVRSRDGMAIGRIAMLQDVTDFKAVDRLKSDFLSGVSHDLLSPLTYMGNYTELLLESDDRALNREYAERIRNGVQRMTHLVNDLLEMAHVDAAVNLQPDRIQVNEMLAEVALEYASPAHSSGIQLVVQTPPDLPPVLADPTLLRRAVTNLVTNALKYAPNSGVVLLRAVPQDGELLISVRDHGPGFDPANGARLFEKFYRGQQTTAERARGSGLGLAIVKSIAEHHGGRVWCESEPGAGSEFGLALPLDNAR